MNYLTGEIKSLKESGFGFINFNAEKVFFHFSSVRIPNINRVSIDDLSVGDSVKFKLQEGRKGIEAVNVKITKKATVDGESLSDSEVSNAVLQLQAKFN